uniref:Uncharacterized protein n=1 Tax=Romanomermis culicivorax TaxID=13658 RepID=A0A915KA23_ROMCU
MEKVQYECHSSIQQIFMIHDIVIIGITMNKKLEQWDHRWPRSIRHFINNPGCIPLHKAAHKKWRQRVRPLDFINPAGIEYGNDQ